MSERFAILDRAEELVLSFDDATGEVTSITVERDGHMVCDVIQALKTAQHLREQRLAWGDEAAWLEGQASARLAMTDAP